MKIDYTKFYKGAKTARFSKVSYKEHCQTEANNKKHIDYTKFFK